MFKIKNKNKLELLMLYSKFTAPKVQEYSNFLTLIL